MTWWVSERARERIYSCVVCMKSEILFLFFCLDSNSISMQIKVITAWCLEDKTANVFIEIKRKKEKLCAVNTQNANYKIKISTSLTHRTCFAMTMSCHLHLQHFWFSAVLCVYIYSIFKCGIFILFFHCDLV